MWPSLSQQLDDMPRPLAVLVCIAAAAFFIAPLTAMLVSFFT